MNGWTNVETWLAVVHIENDSKHERGKTIYCSNAIMETRCYKSIKDFADKCEKYSDFKSEFEQYGDFRDKINWQEIFDYFKYDDRFPDNKGIFLVDSAKELLKLFKADKDTIYLPDFQIDRDFYLECKTIIESYGYVYKSKNFVKKDADAEADLQKMIDGVEVLTARKQFDFYPTPDEVVKKAQELLCYDGKSDILEPSCGLGNLVKGYEEHTKAIEINPDCISELQSKGIDVIGKDFEKETPKKFKYIIMNPPFGKRKDAKHVILAFNEWLADGGVLVAITSGGIMSNKDKYCKEFQELYSKHGVHQESIEQGAFKESGTNISTMIHKFVKVGKKRSGASLF